MTHPSLFVFVLLLSAPARAEPPRVAEPPPVTYDFDDELVAGDYPTPKETLVVSRARSGRASLVHVRESFIAELVKAVDDL